MSTNLEKPSCIIFLLHVQLISANSTVSQTCTHISNVHHACNKRAHASLGRMLTRFIVSVSKVIKTCLSLCDQSPAHHPL